MKFQFVRINKPPPVDSLYIGSRYMVTGSEGLEIIPQVSIQVFAAPQGLMPGLEACEEGHRALQQTEIEEKATGIGRGETCHLNIKVQWKATSGATQGCRSGPEERGSLWHREGCGGHEEGQPRLRMCE